MAMARSMSIRRGWSFPARKSFSRIARRRCARTGAVVGVVTLHLLRQFYLDFTAQSYSVGHMPKPKPLPAFLRATPRRVERPTQPKGAVWCCRCSSWLAKDLFSPGQMAAREDLRVCSPCVSKGAAAARERKRAKTAISAAYPAEEIAAMHLKVRQATGLRGFRLALAADAMMKRLDKPCSACGGTVGAEYRLLASNSGPLLVCLICFGIVRGAGMDLDTLRLHYREVGLRAVAAATSPEDEPTDYAASGVPA